MSISNMLYIVGVTIATSLFLSVSFQAISNMLSIVAVTIATSLFLSVSCQALMSISNMLYNVAVTLAASLYLSVSCQLFCIYKQYAIHCSSYYSNPFFLVCLKVRCWLLLAISFTL